MTLPKEHNNFLVTDPKEVEISVIEKNPNYFKIQENIDNSMKSGKQYIYETRSSTKIQKSQKRTK